MKMTSLSFFLVALILAGTQNVEADITTEILQTDEYDFTCTILKHNSPDPDAPIKEVMFLHGFPMYRKFWHPVLFYWDNLLKEPEEGRSLPPVSVHAVACDLRGYSPGASPNSIEDYDYWPFGTDVGKLVNASGFDSHSFHLVGHDHGAGLAWELAAFKNVKLHSLTTMSVPHNDLMSEALCGPNEDQEQIVASNYFNQFALPDSAIRNNGGLTKLFEAKVGPMEPEDFQKLLWWYNGTMAKYWSMPRVVSDEEVLALFGTPLEETAQVIMAVRNAIPMEERPCTRPPDNVGPVTDDTLFVCGVHDTSILCNNSYAYDFSPDLLPNYERANFACGHEFFNDGDCSSMDESYAVMEKMTEFILTNKTGAKVRQAKIESTPTSSASTVGITQKRPHLVLSGIALMALSSLLW